MSDIILRKDTAGFHIIKCNPVIRDMPDEWLRHMLFHAGPYAAVDHQVDGTFLLKLHDDDDRKVIYRGTTCFEDNTHTLKWVD